MFWYHLGPAQMILMTSKLVLTPPALTFNFSFSSLLVGLPSCLSCLALGMQIIPEHHQNTPGVKPAIVSPFGSSQPCLRHSEDNTASRKCWGFSASDATCFGGTLEVSCCHQQSGR